MDKFIDIIYKSLREVAAPNRKYGTRWWHCKVIRFLNIFSFSLFKQQQIKEQFIVQLICLFGVTFSFEFFFKLFSTIFEMNLYLKSLRVVRIFRNLFQNFIKQKQHHNNFGPMQVRNTFICSLFVHLICFGRKIRVIFHSNNWYNPIPKVNFMDHSST